MSDMTGSKEQIAASAAQLFNHLYQACNVLHGHISSGRVRNYGGSNAYPPYWPELQRTFRPFFKEAGIEF